MIISELDFFCHLEISSNSQKSVQKGKRERDFRHPGMPNKGYLMDPAAVQDGNTGGEQEGSKREDA